MTLDYFSAYVLEKFFEQADVDGKIYHAGAATHQFPAIVKQALVDFRNQLAQKLKGPHDDPHQEVPADLQQYLLAQYDKLARPLVQALTHYFDGNILQATETFNRALKKIDFINLIPVFDGAVPSFSSTYVTAPDGTQIPRYPIKTVDSSFYRAQVNSAAQLEQKRLFHPPFEVRHNVKTNRYSIPGLPALYLGGSVYTTWLESGSPDLNQMHVSRFTPTRELRLVRILRPFSVYTLVQDMGRAYAEAGKQKEGLEKVSALSIAYLTLLPLIIASMFVVNSADAPFKPEYIIPQLLLQYVSRHTEIDGIMFPSTKAPLFIQNRADKNNPAVNTLDTYNYVFPVKKSQPTGYAPGLIALFHLTEPVAFITEQIPYFEHNEVKVEGNIALAPSMTRAYKDTRFGRVEFMLAGMPTLPLKL